MVGILTVNFQSLSFLFFMHALCAHAQGSVDLHVESYGVAGPLVETLYIDSWESKGCVSPADADSTDAGTV